MDKVRVRALVPLLKVKSVPTSIDFYAKLGFTVRNTSADDATLEPQWASMTAGEVEIMLGRSDDAGGRTPDALYLYADSVDELHKHAREAGLAPSAISRPAFNPGGEFELTDPDGHSVYVA